MNPSEDTRPPTLLSVLRDLHQKIKDRAETWIKLTQHPDTTDEQVVAAMISSRTFHKNCREMYETLQVDLKLVGIELADYDRLPFVASPFAEVKSAEARHMAHLPISRIKHKIKQAKALKS